MAKTKAAKKVSSASRKQRRSKKPEKKTTFESIQEVIEAAEECRRLIERGIITLELQYPHEIIFRIDDEKYRATGKAEAESNRFLSLLRNIVKRGLIAALTGDITDGFPPPQAFDADPKQYRDEVEKIRDEVGRLLCDNELRAWYQIKSSSKNRVLQRVDWEINLKQTERMTGDVGGIPHATLRLSLCEPGGHKKVGAVESFLSALGASAPTDEGIVIDMHTSDIHLLVQDLNEILDSFKEKSPS